MVSIVARGASSACAREGLALTTREQRAEQASHGHETSIDARADQRGEPSARNEKWRERIVELAAHLRTRRGRREPKRSTDRVAALRVDARGGRWTEWSARLRPDELE